MPARAVTVNIPEVVYERLRETSEATARSIQEVLAHAIALSLPPLEEDLSTEIRAELAGLVMLSDEELRDLAKRPMAEDKQAELEALAQLQKKRVLTPPEQSSLERLMEEAQRVMLRRAEVYRTLAQRGYQVFAPPKA